MNSKFGILGFGLGAALMLATAGIVYPLHAATQLTTADYISSKEPPVFDGAGKAVDAFKAALAANNFDGLAALLGLDGAKLKTADGVMDTYNRIRQGAAKLLVVEDYGDREEIDIGEQLWPFPFPLVRGKDGKWAFDTYAGIEEIIRRRIGENELQAIKTTRLYVDAQRDYASEDHDGDAVLEYAQKLISTPGRTDGLYWSPEQGDGESPVGPLIQPAALQKAKEGRGYFGYHFRILKGQGGNVAGGKYDYVINGNMIAGFALVAWPVRYGETGIETFVVNQAGIVYEKDLGPNTDALVRKIHRFNPDKTWDIVAQ